MKKVKRRKRKREEHSSQSSFLNKHVLSIKVGPPAGWPSRCAAKCSTHIIDRSKLGLLPSDDRSFLFTLRRTAFNLSPLVCRTPVPTPRRSRAVRRMTRSSARYYHAQNKTNEDIFLKSVFFATVNPNVSKMFKYKY